MKRQFIAMPVVSLAGLILTCSLTPASVEAAKAPKALVTDSRVKQVIYDPDQVYDIVGTFGFQTSIEFARDERIKAVALGDTIAWQTIPYQNRLFLKPVEPDAATNLTVTTDKRTYYFMLTSSKVRTAPTFLVRFQYPNSSMGIKTVDGGTSRNRGGIDLERLNIDYSTSGDKSTIQLRRAFDDGEFTYFLIAQSTETPSVYAVGTDGTESIVNTRREGPYLVVERTAGQFTLRNGSAYLCVRNNAMADRRLVASRSEMREDPR